jgi:hypothetical protein
MNYYEYEVFRTKEDAEKGDSVLRTTRYNRAKEIAYEISGVVIENTYEYSDSELVDDFTDEEEDDEPTE